MKMTLKTLVKVKKTKGKNEISLLNLTDLSHTIPNQAYINDPESNNTVKTVHVTAYDKAVGYILTLTTLTSESIK